MPRSAPVPPAAKSAVPATLLLLLTLACSANPWERGDPAETPVTVTVENHNFNDATIYAVIRTSRIRLGRVTGNGSQTFELPYRPTDVAFLIDLLAGRTFTTNSVLVSPGDEVQLVIAADLAASRVYR